MSTVADKLAKKSSSKTSAKQVRLRLVYVDFWSAVKLSFLAAVALAIAYLCKLAGGALGAVTLATTFVTCLAYAAAFFAVAFFFLFDERTKARVGRVYLSLLGKRAIH